MLPNNLRTTTKTLSKRLAQSTSKVVKQVKQIPAKTTPHRVKPSASKVTEKFTRHSASTSVKTQPSASRIAGRAATSSGQEHRETLHKAAQPQPPKLRPRFLVLKLFSLLLFTLILLRLFMIQILDHDTWVAKADKQHTLLETISPKRGEIYMMDHGNPVAVVLNQSAYQVVIDPTVTQKEDIEYIMNTFAQDYAAADLDEVYNTENLRYAIVAKNLPRAVAEQIANAGVPAIWLKKINQRVYPEGELASGLLGFVNNDGVGQYGVEGSFNEELAGKEGLLKTTADVNKVALSIGDDNVKIPAEDGQNIVLSIDRGLEEGVEELAQQAINNTAATNASVLIMNPNTGEVLTMANLPTYNPADYSNVEDISAFVNYTTEVPYEPASICKSFAFAAAIEEGKMTADTTYFNNHYEVVDGWRIQNAEQRSFLYGEISMKTALYWSLNTGSIHALKLLGGNPNAINQQGREKLYDYYYNRFKLGQASGIELAEAIGYIPDPNEGWGRDSTYANMTFGQNLQITMVQTAAAWSAVVNGGVYHAPTVVKGTMENGELVAKNHSATDKNEASASKITETTDETTTNGEEATEVAETEALEDLSDDSASTTETPENITSAEPQGEKGERVLSAETSAAMRAMLQNNRDYKVRGDIDKPGYAIGGKSGTAQVVVNGAYDDTFAQLVGSYIGFVGPEGELPKFVIMVKMWGEGQSINSDDAMGLFDTISNYLIDYLKIKPKV